MLYIDVKYLNLASSNLERFQQTDRSVWISRCPFCGDSKKSKYKRRFYIYEKSNRVVFYCHNCGVTGGMSKLLNHVEPSLKREYNREIYFEKGEFKEQPKKIEKKYSTLECALKINNLFDRDPPVEYLKSRKIPEKYFDLIYHTDDYVSFARNYSNKEPGNVKHPRIIFPYYDENKTIIKTMSRSYTGVEPKYLGLSFSEDAPNLYGLDRIDKTKTVKIVEGIIDSFFVDNCLATGTSVLYNDLDYLSSSKIVLINDNEPRNEEILKIMKRALDRNISMVIWPESFLYKDINEAIVDGISRDEINSIIDNNTFKGLRLKIEFNKWKKFDL